MSFTTPEQYAAYYVERIAYWQRKHERFISARKKAHAIRRISHYTKKLAAHNAAHKSEA